MLQDAPTPLSVSVERVVLAPGPLPLEATSPFVYFPQDALLSLVQAHPAHDAVDVAMVGRHACGGPSELWGAPMLAVVLAGALERKGSPALGQDIGTLAGLGALGIIISDDPLTALAHADGVIDFTAPQATITTAALKIIFSPFISAFTFVIVFPVASVSNCSA